MEQLASFFDLAMSSLSYVAQSYRAMLQVSLETPGSFTQCVRSCLNISASYLALRVALARAFAALATSRSSANLLCMLKKPLITNISSAESMSS